MHKLEPGNLEIIQNVQKRVSNSVANQGLLIDLSTDSCKRYLKGKVNTNDELVIMYIDIAGSTQMSHDLSPRVLSIMIQIFSQEVSLSIERFGGHVLKFVGDAVIALFPCEYNSSMAISNALECAQSIHQIIKEGINPIFQKNSFPEISVKIGIEYGTALVLVYGQNVHHAPIDLIGFSISIASKITSMAYPNEIIVGENIYDNISDSEKQYFLALYDDHQDKWNSVMKYNNNLKYHIYKYIKNNP